MRPTKARNAVILGKLCFLAWVSMTAVACQTPEVSEHIYGLWHEPIEGGGVELREDGTAVWYGQDATFEVEVERVGRMSCGFSVLGCYYGDVTIRVGDQVHRTRYYDRVMTAETQVWGMNFESPVRTPSGRQVDALRLRRVEAIGGPQTWPGFERMDAGLPEYYPGDGQFHRVAGRFLRSRTQPYAEGPELHLWDAEAEIWRLRVPARDGNRFIMGESVIYSEDGTYSTDGGVTFSDTRPISDIPEDREALTPVILGREVIVLARFENEDDRTGNEVWALDLAADQPAWLRRHRFVEGNYSAELSAATVADVLIIGWLHDDGALRSDDRGRTWRLINAEGTGCQDSFRVEPHPAGCWCTDDEARYVYDARDDAWVTFELGGWTGDVARAPQGSLSATYPLFTIDDDTLVLLTWDGQRVPTVALPAGFEGYRLDVYNDVLVYRHYAVWRAPFVL